MKLSLIVAMAENRVIGLKNQMPWHLSADLKRFKQLTMGCPMLMGRLTFESIGRRVLPGRTTIVVSRHPENLRQYQQDNCLIVDSVAAGIAAGCRLADEIFIIGGSTLYQATMDKADSLYITYINKTIAGDTFFPEFEASDWQIVQNEQVEDDATVDFSYRFVKMIRKPG